MSKLKALLDKFSLRKQFDTESEYQAVMKSAAQDEMVMGRRTVMTIIIFEIAMILFTVCEWERTTQIICYFAGYIFLLIASIAVFFVMAYIKRDIDRRYVLVKRFELYYDIALMVWAVYMTTVENMYKSGFSALVFITILVIIPVVTFISPGEYTLIHTGGCVCILFVIFLFSERGKFGDIINFSVFSIISFVSGISFYGIRLKSYKRQAQLAELANVDGLSGLYNRQKLGRVSPEIWSGCVKNRTPLTCVLCDIDDFKKINDRYGHIIGDECITKVSQIIKSSGTRETDMFFRYGGEEFMMVLPGTDTDAARAQAENIMKQLHDIRTESGDYPEITLSFGIFTGYPDDENGNIEKYFSNADKLLYDAKRNGKNRYQVLTEK